TPAPGGGTSSAVMLTVVGPSIAVDRTTALRTGPLVVTLSNGPGEVGEYLGIYPVNTPANSAQWQYSGGGTTTKAGVTNGSVTWPRPGTTLPAGDYIVKWWTAGGDPIAQSPVVTFAEAAPAPVLGSLSPASVVAGSSAFTLRVLGSGLRSTSVIQIGGAARTTTFVSAGELTTS